MLSLALDSSNQSLAVALLDDDQLLGQVLITIKKNHSITLMPTIDYLVATCDVDKAAIGRIVVAQGPGSYTGLRIAVATAKTLAMALDAELVGVSSLYALTDAETAGLQVPLINARRQAVYAGLYLEGQAQSADRYQPLVELLDSLQDQDQLTFVGEVAGFEDLIRERLPQAAIKATQPDAYRLGLRGLDLLPVDVDAFVPAYLKQVEAEEKWQESHPSAQSGDYITRI